MRQNKIKIEYSIVIKSISRWKCEVKKTIKGMSRLLNTCPITAAIYDEIDDIIFCPVIFKPILKNKDSLEKKISK